MRKVVTLLSLFCALASAMTPCSLTWPDINNETTPKVVHVDVNLVDLLDCGNEDRDSITNIINAMGGSTGATGLSSTGDIKVTIDRDSNTTGSRFWVANHTTDTLFRVQDDSTAKFSGNLTANKKLIVTDSARIPLISSDLTAAQNLTVGKKLVVTDSARIPVISSALTLGQTLGVTGAATFTAKPIFSTLTASLPVFSDGSKGAVSNAMTGTGNVMMSASPTTTGTLTGASANFSGTLGVTGPILLNGATTAAAWGLIASDMHLAVTTGRSLYSFGVGDPATTLVSGTTEFARLIHTGTNGVIEVAKTGSGTYRDLLLKTNNTTQLTISGSTGAATFASSIAAAGLTSTGDIRASGTGAATYGTVVPMGVQNTSNTANNYEEIGFKESNGNFIAAIAGINTTHNALASTSAGALAFLTKTTAVGSYPAERMRIHQTGNVSIGSATDNGFGLEVTGTAKVTSTLAVTGAATASTIALGGNEAFDYDEGSFTVELTGVSGTVTGTAYFERIGKRVFLTLPALTGTSDSTGCALAGFPAAIRPTFARGTYYPVTINNGSTAAGPLQASSAQILTDRLNLYWGSSASGFTASGTKGLFASLDINYTLQ